MRINVSTERIFVQKNVPLPQILVQINVTISYIFVQKNVDMKRNILSKLIEWKNKKNRKPLIVNGARQVGKTYILREFGTSQYEKMAYVNCDKNKILEKIFSQDYNISRILLSLSAILHVNIEPENTLKIGRAHV